MLLVNDGLLPLPDAERSPVWRSSGPMPAQLAMGGGSSEVTPHRRRAGRRGAGRAPPGRGHLLGGGVPYRPRPALDRPAPASTARAFRIDVLRPGRSTVGSAGGDGVGAHGAHHVDRPAAAGPDDREVRRPHQRAPSPPTCRVRGGSGSRAPGARCCGWTATWSSTTPNRCGAQGFYGAGSEPVEAACDLEAGRAYELSVDVWPRSWPPPRSWVPASGRRGPTAATSSSGPSPPRAPRTWPWSWSAPTGSGSPRATTDPTCRCPVASAS